MDNIAVCKSFCGAIRDILNGTPIENLGQIIKPWFTKKDGLFYKENLSTDEFELQLLAFETYKCATEENRILKGDNPQEVYRCTDSDIKFYGDSVLMWSSANKRNLRNFLEKYAKVE